MRHGKVTAITKEFYLVEEITNPCPHTGWSRRTETQTTLQHLRPHGDDLIYRGLGLVRTVRLIASQQMCHTFLIINIIPRRPTQVLTNW